MPVIIEDAVLQAAHLDEATVKLELALALYGQDRLTMGQASRFAGIGQLDFQAHLAERRIPLHYDSEDLHQDFENLKALGQL